MYIFMSAEKKAFRTKTKLVTVETNERDLKYSLLQSKCYNYS